MKQKIVIEVSMHDQKSRKKALKTAVSVCGVESASLGGQDKNQIVVTGNDVDSVALTTLLRNSMGHATLLRRCHAMLLCKNLGHADLVSVGPAGDDTDKKENKSEAADWPTYYGNCYLPHFAVCEVPTYNPSCSIL